jgi:multicomponent Na+:H+ antiporter subunit C
VCGHAGKEGIMIERILIATLFLIGFWGIIAKKNIIKKIFSLSILNSSVVILFIVEGSRIGKNAPIMEDGIKTVVDPVPQALMLTAIVIGVCITALALALAFRLYRYAGTFDIDRIREKAHDESY